MSGGWIDWLKRRRHRLDDVLTRRGLAHTFSLARRRLHRRTLRLLADVSGGRLLDIGSGRSPFKPLLVARGVEVISLDVEDRAGEVDLLADAQRMPEVEDGSVDAVLCTQVLEHLPRPWDALGEIARVLRPGGRLILSVPHLSMIHEAPHDYYRYTRHGLDSLCARAGLEVVGIEATGGLCCFLGHALSLALMSTVGAIPGLRWATWLVNYLVLVLLLEPIDRLAGLARLFPCDYCLLARKPGEPAEA